MTKNKQKKRNLIIGIIAILAVFVMIKKHNQEKEAEIENLKNQVAQLVSEENKIAESEEKARKESEEKAREESEEKAKRESSKKARQESYEKAKQESFEKQQQEQEEKRQKRVNRKAYRNPQTEETPEEKQKRLNQESISAQQPQGVDYNINRMQGTIKSLTQQEYRDYLTRHYNITIEDIAAEGLGSREHYGVLLSDDQLTLKMVDKSTDFIFPSWGVKKVLIDFDVTEFDNEKVCIEVDIFDMYKEDGRVYMKNFRKMFVVE